MRDVLRAGADKVSLNTAAVADPGLIVALRGAVRAPGGRRRDRRPASRERRRSEPAAGRSSSRAGASRPGSTPWPGPSGRSSSGAGELLVTSIDRDGTRSGYDTALLRAITSRVAVPVIASGGAAGPADFVAAVRRRRRRRRARRVDLPSPDPLDRRRSRRRWPRPGCRSGSCRGGGMTAGRCGPRRDRASDWRRRPGRRRSSRTPPTAGC